MTRISTFLSITALVVAGASGIAVSAPASAANPPGLPVYLALGDSITNGENSDAPSNIDDYWAAVAKWRADGYVTPFYTDLKSELNCLPAASTNAAPGCGQLELLNLARSAIPPSGSDPGKPGLTSDLFIQEQLAPAETLLRSRNQNANPRDNAQVVTLTVGGNEIFDAFMTGDQERIRQAFQTFIVNYIEILGRLRAAAGPDMPIITMTYFNPLPYCGYPDPDQGAILGNYILEQLPTPVGNGLNGVIRNVSAQFGAVPAEGFGILGNGDFANCRHPNEAGYAKLAQAFENAWVKSV